jgi:hypothetical protein
MLFTASNLDPYFTTNGFTDKPYFDDVDDDDDDNDDGGLNTRELSSSNNTSPHA